MPAIPQPSRFGTVTRGLAVLALAIPLVFAGACSPPGVETADSEAPGAEAPEAATPLSIVVLGDSVAAGEGINYGYVYKTSPVYHWSGGTDNPTWQPPYPYCHDSDQAYGEVVAADLGAKLFKFACTGATYDNGLIFERIVGTQVYRPAEFGDWITKADLNPEYDQAKPDVVILTFGADDVSFVDIVTYCATGYTLDDTAEVEALATAEDPGKKIREGFTARFPTTEALTAARATPKATLTSSYCTAANPGKPIETLFWDPIKSGEIANHYVQMVDFIQERGKAAGKVPQIVFTTYHNPLPGPTESIDCLDVGDLERDEVDYLISLENTLDSTIKAAVGSLPGVSVADISQVMDGHKWCTKDPWTYGLSILLLNDDSQAPFHPTPAGQQAIAKVVEAAIPKI